MQSVDKTTAQGQMQGVGCGGGFGEYNGMFDAMHRDRFDKIDRELMRELGELKEAIAEFDSYRHAWAEMSANDCKPGRGSELAKRLEVMQGYALMNLDGCAWRLRLRIREEHSSPNITVRDGEDRASHSPAT